MTMADFSASADCTAAAREVWKLLYDPVRFASWWPGWERVENAPGGATHYDARSPDFAYPAAVSTDAAGGRIVVSCMLSDIVHTWSIRPHPPGCTVSVEVTIPDAVGDKIEQALADTRTALAALVACAESSA
jgi:hypothetical protein